MGVISLDQVIPNAKKYEERHQTLYGRLAGTAVSRELL